MMDQGKGYADTSVSPRGPPLSETSLPALMGTNAIQCVATAQHREGATKRNTQSSAIPGAGTRRTPIRERWVGKPTVAGFNHHGHNRTDPPRWHGEACGLLRTLGGDVFAVPLRLRDLAPPSGSPEGAPDLPRTGHSAPADRPSHGAPVQPDAVGDTHARCGTPFE